MTDEEIRALPWADDLLDSMDLDEAIETIQNPQGYLDKLNSGQDGDGDQPAHLRTPESDPDNEAHSNTDANAGNRGGAGNDDQRYSVPESWMVDPETNQPYRNGMILGKYKTAKDALEAVPHMMKVIGRNKEKTIETPPANLPPAPTNVRIPDEDMEQIETFALDRVIDRHDKSFREAGLDPADYRGAKFAQLRTDDPGLFAILSVQREQERALVLEHVRGHADTVSRIDVLQTEAIESAHENVLAYFEQNIGVEPDAEDVEYFRGQMTEFVAPLLEWDKNLRASMAQGYNPLTDPRVRPTIDQYYTVKFGVPVLDDAKVASAAKNAMQPLLIEAVRSHATKETADRVSRDLRMQREAADPFPFMMGMEANDGVTGSHLPEFTIDDMRHPDFFDRLVEQFDGDEDKAQAYVDRVYDKAESLRQQSNDRNY